MLFTRLSLFYFAYFALLGAMAPYLGVYLESRGFSLIEIAQLSSVLMVTKVVAPNIWGHLGDLSGRRLLLVRVGACATLIGYIGFFFAHTFWHYVIVIALFSFFWNAVLAQFEVVTLFNLGERRQEYSRVRLWGSVGFIASVALLGYVFEYAGIHWLPVALVIIISAILVASMQQFNEPVRLLGEAGSVRSFLSHFKRAEVLSFFIACFLMQLSHGTYYTYFSIYLEGLGYSKSDIGWLWALGVLAEVILFLGMHKFLEKTADVSIMCLALMLTGLRWLMISFASSSLFILLLAQLLHAFSFGAMHAAAIHFVHRSFAENVQGKAQAFYSSIGFGLGGAVGALLSGVLVLWVSYYGAFMFSALIALLALIVLWSNRRHSSSLGS